MIKARALCIGLVVACIGCANPPLEPQKFDGVDYAALAVQTDIKTTAGSGSTQFPALLHAFEAELSRLERRTSGTREAAAAEAFAAAAEAYRYLLRFKLLERDAVGGMVLLSGANRPIASRFKFPMENRGGGRWVNRRTAMTILSDSADAALVDAHKLLAAH